MKPPCFKNPV